MPWEAAAVLIIAEDGLLCHASGLYIGFPLRGILPSLRGDLRRRSGWNDGAHDWVIQCGSRNIAISYVTRISV